ncbi:hypothetical protein L911_2227 [Vibrio fluvialis I21563]|nr:hypothetical protein L911_2227 [Vibrio fluvialis I21563]
MLVDSTHLSTAPTQKQPCFSLLDLANTRSVKPAMLTMPIARLSLLVLNALN